MNTATQRSSVPQHSPCVGVCALDQKTGWCLGCGRDMDEISRWATMATEEQGACWDDIPRRLDLLSVRARLLPWTATEIGDWARRVLLEEHGTIVVGVPGAVAEFPCGPEYGVACEDSEAFVIACAPKAAFRLELHKKLRAFSYGASGPIVLGLPKTRAKLPVAHTLTLLGPDLEAVEPHCREHLRFDFGLGRASSRFCVRTDEPELQSALNALCGSTWQEALARIGPALLAQTPHRVVESALARIDVYAPIPAPGTTTEPGAHTHFLPEFLKSEDESPAGLTLPDFAQPVAIYYPAKD